MGCRAALSVGAAGQSGEVMPPDSPAALGSLGPCSGLEPSVGTMVELVFQNILTCSKLIFFFSYSYLKPFII